MTVSTLKNLTFTVAPKAETNPVLMRRKEVVARLETQKKLVADPNFTKTIKGKNGEKQQRVLPMFRPVDDGSYAFVLKAGFSPIEFEKARRRFTCRRSTSCRR